MNIITKLKNIRKNGQKVFQSLLDDGFSKELAIHGRSESISIDCREIGICAKFDNLNLFLVKPLYGRVSSRQLSRLAKAALKQGKLVYLGSYHTLNNYSDLRKVKFL